MTTKLTSSYRIEWFGCINLRCSVKEFMNPKCFNFQIRLYTYPSGDSSLVCSQNRLQFIWSLFQFYQLILESQFFWRIPFFSVGSVGFVWVIWHGWYRADLSCNRSLRSCSTRIWPWRKVYELWRAQTFADVPHRSWCYLGILPKKQGFYMKNLKILTWLIKAMINGSKNWYLRYFFQIQITLKSFLR